MPLTVLVSCAMDLVWRIPAFPRPGQSIAEAKFQRFPGGKGANQAVQAARLGAEVTAIGCVGDDEFGQVILDILRQDGVNADGVRVVPGVSTATAGIYVEASGQNTICIDLGANRCVTENDVTTHMPFASENLVLSQLEIPVEATLAAAQRGRLCLNPAPAAPIAEEIWARTWLFVPNQTEAEFYVQAPVRNLEEAREAARQLLARGPQHVVITMGDQGAYWQDRAGEEFFAPAPKVEAVDTVAAGDSFCAALAVSLDQGHEFPNAIAFAVRVASLSVTRSGAMPSLPYRHEINTN